jgi:fructose-bisphosphate aldolase class I
MNAKMLEKMHSGKGFIAALDQSGGSTPKALGLYGVTPDAWGDDEEKMMDLVHEMRTGSSPTRISMAIGFSAPSFSKPRWNGRLKACLRPTISGRKKGVVPFLKVDKGLADEADGVRLMKPFPGLDELCKEAVKFHIFRHQREKRYLKGFAFGIKAVVAQQYEWAKVMIKNGLCPIIEPEVDIHIPDKKEAEAILKEELLSPRQALKARTKKSCSSSRSRPSRTSTKILKSSPAASGWSPYRAAIARKKPISCSRRTKA